MNARGFTLVEMLVALALLSLMSLSVLQAYRFSQRTLAQVTLLDAATHDVAGAQRLLRRLIEQAYPFEKARASDSAAALIGAADALTLTAPSAAGEGGIGFQRHTLSRDAGGTLQLSWWLDRNGAAAATVRRASEPLLEGVVVLSIAYLELAELGNGDIEANWRDEWIDAASLPALIRIRVAFAPDDRRRWPELIVAPRVTADANCEFDLVSQQCRVSS